MSNRLILRLLTLTALTASILGFQNCSRSLVLEMNEGEAVLASQQGVETPPELQKTSFEPVLMDRYTIRAFLKDVFGAGTDALPSFALTTNAIEYGSPCSVYENYLSFNGTRNENANPMEVCSLAVANFTSAGVNPKASVTRQAELPRICSDLVHTDATYNTAMSKIAGGAAPALNDQNLKKAFHLFYRDKPAPGESLLDALKLMVETPDHVTKGDWQNVLYTICASGHWQVL